MDYLHDLSDEGEEASLDVSLFLSGWSLEEMSRELVDIFSIGRKIAKVNVYAAQSAKVKYIDGWAKHVTVREFDYIDSRSSEGPRGFTKSVNVDSLGSTSLAFFSIPTKSASANVNFNSVAFF